MEEHPPLIPPIKGGRLPLHLSPLKGEIKWGEGNSSPLNPLLLIKGIDDIQEQLIDIQHKKERYKNGY